MFLVNIFAFILLILIIARKYSTSAVSAWPVAVCIMVLFMYLLSFFNGLWAMDFIGIVFITGFFFSLFFNKNTSFKDEIYIYRKLLVNVQFLGAVLFFVVLTILILDKKVTWWDDYNFWATDAKSIFGLNGFASKYTNVAPEFGDYPPGTQMFKWWFNHFNPSEFSEGLMFSGYYFMLFSFLMPVLDLTRSKNKFLNILNTVITLLIMFLFPSTVEAFWCDGCSADTIMAVIFGSFLICVLRLENSAQSSFFELKAILLLTVLALCKNTAFLWLFLSVLFYLFINIFVTKNLKLKKLFYLVLPPAVSLLSWYGFCYFTRRVAKLTGTALSMVSGSSSIPDYQSELTRVYFNAFIKYPLHRYENGIINLTPLSLFVIFLVAVLILYLCKKISKKEAVTISSFIVVSGVAFLSFYLICHLTIFASEAQYLEEFAMVSSIERYGAPFWIGIFMMLIYLSTKGEKKYPVLIAVSTFVLLTTDYDSSLRAVNGYRESIDETMNTRNEIIDERGREFLNDIKEKKGVRILYVRDIDDISWVRNTYMSFEASPVSLMFKNMDLESASEEEITNAMNEVHATEVYVERGK